MKTCINKKRPEIRWPVTNKEAKQLQTAPETRRKYRFEAVEGLEDAPAPEQPSAPHGVEKKEACGGFDFEGALIKRLGLESTELTRTEENIPEEQPKKKSKKQKTNTETSR